MQKFPQKLSAQRTAKGPVSISECCVDGDYISIENTSKRHDVNMTNWVLTHCVGSVRKVSFKFPENFILKFKQSCKLWAGSRTEINACSSSTQSASQSPNKFTKSSYSGSSSQSSSSSSLSSKSNLLNGNNHHTNGFYLNGTSGSYNQSPATASTTSANSTVSSTNGNDIILTDSIENELVIYDIENWTCGSQEMFIRIENEFGEEKACFRKTN